LGRVQRHLAEASGGNPLFAQTDLVCYIAPLDALGNFGADDLFGDVHAVHKNSLKVVRIKK
jgi:hypothetical protein